ncbi:MAG: OadG family protein [Bacteroidales bacterium]|jgi:hypothetical protein|nr:OadG family protein [Bacteroidales bacterium]
MQLIFQIPEVMIEGGIIAVIGYSIVFSALVGLYFSFFYVGKLLAWNTRRKLAVAGKITAKEMESEVTGEEAAAIAAAIFLCRDLHDDESDVITIKRVSKVYSPWSSKIYGLRNYSR